MTECDIHPEQTNNEIRNAVTHLSRAPNAATQEGADEEITKAVLHIERAKRDCLKLTIITKIEQLRSMLSRIEEKDGILRQEVRSKVRKINSDRKDIYIRETKGDDIANDLTELLIDICDFEDYLSTQYNIPSTREIKVARWFRSARSGIPSF